MANYGFGPGGELGDVFADDYSRSALCVIDYKYLEDAIGVIENLCEDFEDRLQQLSNMGSALSVADMMKLQYESNRLNQLVEALSTISSFLKDIVSSITRQIK